MNRFTHLNAALMPLVEGETSPAERLPEPNWIPITKEEKERMFPKWNPPPLLTTEDFNADNRQHPRMGNAIAGSSGPNEGGSE